jgi:hypothetical protein
MGEAGPIGILAMWGYRTSDIRHSGATELHYPNRKIRLDVG